MIGAGNVDDGLAKPPGTGLGRPGGGGASREMNEFDGFVGACCLRIVFGLGARAPSIGMSKLLFAG